MIFNGGLNFITAPARATSKIVRRGSRAGKQKSAAGMGAASDAITKSGGGAVARAISPEELFAAEYQAERQTGFETLLFRQLPRPRLTERSASDLTLEQARTYADESARFYDYEFPLFPSGEFFYEEVEEQFVAGALGVEQNSIDRRFADVSTTFRRTLNANTRRLVLFWTPGLLAAALAGGWALTMFGASAAPQITWLAEEAAAAAVAFALACSMAALLLLTLVSWPYKVVQQRNLMNLDNYVTSKFARINNNFQVAKRRALNVERDKRMSQRDELKEEAAVWTLAYQWFAMRLFLCELLIRNKFYQVRRNTALYWGGGIFLALGILIAAVALELLARAPAAAIATAVFGAGYIVAAAAMLRGIAPMMFRIIQANEWSRFHLVNLHRAVADHVGEDKVQIVTFRDRNRME